MAQEAVLNNPVKFTPTHQNVHVEVVKITEAIRGKLIVPNTANLDRMGFFRVISVGPGYFDPGSRERTPMCCKPGDYVLVEPGLVKSFTYCGVAIQVVQDQDVLGVIQIEDGDITIAGDGRPAFGPEDARALSMNDPTVEIVDSTGQRWVNGARVPQVTL